MGKKKFLTKTKCQNWRQSLRMQKINMGSVELCKFKGKNGICWYYKMYLCVSIYHVQLYMKFKINNTLFFYSIKIRQTTYIQHIKFRKILKTSKNITAFNFFYIQAHNNQKDQQKLQLLRQWRCIHVDWGAPEQSPRKDQVPQNTFRSTQAKNVYLHLAGEKLKKDIQETLDTFWWARNWYKKKAQHLGNLLVPNTLYNTFWKFH